MFNSCIAVLVHQPYSSTFSTLIGACFALPVSTLYAVTTGGATVGPGLPLGVLTACRDGNIQIIL